MDFDLKLHLLNLKIFSDFDRSPFSRFQRFIEYIDAGNRLSSLYEQDEKEEGLVVEDPLFDYEPTVEEIEEVKQQPERDFLAEYIEHIGLYIEKLIGCFPGIPDVFDLKKLDEELFKKYPDIREFVQADQALINKYADLIQYDGPEEFFNVLAIEDPMEPEEESDTSVKEKECHLAFFVDCKAYNFFKRLQENINSKSFLSDYSCIYWRMQADKLLHHHIGKKDFSTFLADHFDTEPMTLHHQGRAKKAAFNESYSNIKQLVYTDS